MFSENALKILELRYLKKDKDGNIIESYEDLFHRVAETISNGDKNREDIFYKMMINQEFMPNTPTLLNAGRELGQLSACFVLPIEGTIESICETAKNTALIHKTGGGTGFNFTKTYIKNNKIAQKIKNNNICFSFFIKDSHSDLYNNCPKDLIKTQITVCDRFDSEQYVIQGVLYKKSELNIMHINLKDNMNSIFDFYKLIESINEIIKYPNIHNCINIDFSNIRPSGSIVRSTAGVASGPFSFMKVWDKFIQLIKKESITPIDVIKFFNYNTEAVKQGGTRRGASMGILNWDSPFIYDFINCKKNNEEITNFNLSVGITDEFFGEELKIKKPDLFNKITEGAWKNGEPGLIFLDEINRKNPIKTNIEATNPCVVGETLILTDAGYKRIDDCVNKSINIWNGYHWSHVTPEITATNQEILKIDFDDGSFIKCTPYHKFILQDNLRIEAKKLKIGDKLNYFEYPIIKDGKKINPNLAYTIGYSCWGEERYNKENISNLFSLFDKKYKNISDVLYNNKILYSELLYHSRWSDDFDIEDRWELFKIPFDFDLDSKLRWLEGLLFFNSYITKDNHIQIRSINLPFLRKLKLMLSTMGIFSKIDLKKKLDYKKMTKIYCFRLNIEPVMVKKLIDIGLNLNTNLDFSNIKHSENKFDFKFEIKITNISRKRKLEDLVYCFNETSNHSGIFNGIMTGNCGEQPLLPYESCNLGSINLEKCLKYKNEIFDNVDSPYEIDYDKLRYLVENAITFLDLIIDTNVYPLPEIEEITKKYRKIGLGVMGLANMFYKLNIPYNSEKAVKISEELSKNIQEIARKKSVLLFMKKNEIAYSNYNMLLNESFYDELKEEFKNNHIQSSKNLSLTTIAPTGTISLISDTTSGIEPEFFLVTKRNIVGIEDPIYKFNSILENKINNLPLSKEDMEKLKELLSIYNTFDNKEIKDIFCKNDHTNYFLPYLNNMYDLFTKIFITSHQIEPIWHLKHQAAWQKHVDSAISKTINMPNNATIDDVKQIYLLAVENGCKGITVYRDGSRESQVVNKMKEDKNIIKNNVDLFSDDNTSHILESNKIINNNLIFKLEDGTEVKIDYNNTYTDDNKKKSQKRGSILQGFTKKFHIGCGNLYITCNYDEEFNIKEVFIQPGKSGGCSSNVEAIGRTLSVSLRNGVPIEELTQQLRGIKCHSCVKNPNVNILSCSDGIGRFINDINKLLKEKKIINQLNLFDTKQQQSVMYKKPDNENKVKCPECGTGLIHESGCVKCMECGYSKC